MGDPSRCVVLPAPRPEPADADEEYGPERQPGEPQRGAVAAVRDMAGLVAATRAGLARRRLVGRRAGLIGRGGRAALVRRRGAGLPLVGRRATRSGLPGSGLIGWGGARCRLVGRCAA